MDDRTYSKSREKSLERSSQDKKTHTSDKRSRDEHYGSSDRHHHSSHREKRRDYGDERNSRYERGSSRSHRDRSRERSSWSSSRRTGSKDRTSSKSQKERSSYHRRDTATVLKESSIDNSLPVGPKADMIISQPVTAHTDQPPTAPAAYYQQPQTQQSQHHHHQPQPQDPQQVAANEAAWSNYYNNNWTAADYANAGYQTEYTAEQYQQYQLYMQYYQTQDPNGYYAYYDQAYYQQPQQPQQQEIPPPPPTTNNNNPPPPPPTTSRTDVPPPPPPITQTSQTTETPYTGSFAGVSEAALDDVGYPFQTSEDPSTLFEKIGQVGEGTYGKVYKARNGKTGKLMALKRIRMKTEKDGFPITAMREIKLLQKLKHNRIVELQEIMVAKGSVYMVLEYMDHDLSGILGHPNFNFEPAHAKSLVKQMLEGLAYLHHMGILHRDIKGSNLLINNKGELKIADFGLARVFEKNRVHDYTNRVITLWYRPPELLLGATAYGPAVDIWSVGCIMLEFFTGKAVFSGVDEITQLDSIYKIMGTPSEENWPTVKELPWYAMVRPNENYVSKFRESFQSLLSPGALELSEALLSMDPLKRPTAAQALEFNYFKIESPEPIMPANLLDIAGDWHEFESKQRKRQKGPNTLNTNNNKSKSQDNRTKATPSSALSSSSRPH
ncbi:hypothetical protein INT48_005408 [Thamnidium elegans]|uniref:Protein kinase domain-containing protein n=1 Tax=Thamnidium elegans TaxID=101142 RepID=A0A8H7SQC1_9FUNG|nr:hypothetical protein INT48_005408 [Thamnidium elegans]